MALSIKFPLSVGTNKDFKDFDNEKQLVNFQIKNILFTNPGERISIPNFGVGIKKFLFEPNLSSTRGRIRNTIIGQLSTYLSTATVRSVDVTMIDEDSIGIKIAYYLKGQTELGLFEADLSSNSSMNSVQYWGKNRCQKNH